MRSTRTRVVTGSALLALLAGACSPSGEEQNAGGGDGQGDEAAEQEVPEEFVRAGRLFLDNGDSPRVEVEVQEIQAAPDSTALLLDVTNLDATSTGTFASAGFRGGRPFLFDPVTATTYPVMLDGHPTNAGKAYISHDDQQGIPIVDGATNQWRFYFPPLPDDVETLTFFGLGTGGMSGIPVTRLDEREPAPEPGVVGDDGAVEDREPRSGDTVIWPTREPDGNEQANFPETAEYVAAEGITRRRDGETETLAFDVDALFDGDDLSPDGAELLADTAPAIAANSAPDTDTVTITGHTDPGDGGDGADWASAVEEALSAHVDVAFETSGGGAAEPLAAAGAEDPASRRVEISYPAAVGDEAEAAESAPPVVRRSVGEPALFRDDADEPVDSTEHDGFTLDAYPLRRDGGAMVATIELTNNGSEVAEPALGTDRRPEQINGNGLYDFLVRDDATGVTYYPMLMLFEGEYHSFAETPYEYKPGEDLKLSVVFPAPPAETDTVSLEIGEFDATEVPVE